MTAPKTGTSWLRRVTRPARSMAFFAVYAVYLVCPFEVGNRLVALWSRMKPERRRALVGYRTDCWMRWRSAERYGPYSAEIPPPPLPAGGTEATRSPDAAASPRPRSAPEVTPPPCEPVEGPTAPPPDGVPA